MGTTKMRDCSMNIYGYESDDSDLIPLKEITLQVTLNELNELVQFLTNTISLINEHNSNFGHEHFNDFFGKSSSRSSDIIIMHDESC
jgi:hypothetical protein